MADNKKKLAQINSILKEKIGKLSLFQEDILLIERLTASYYRKRTGISNSAPDTMATAFLWVYSKSNFLWEGNKEWSLQSLSKLFNTNSKTVGDIASKIIKSLKIGSWDERFCRQDVMKGNPFDQFIMDKSGFIVSKEMLGSSNFPIKKQSNAKEDYFDEAMDFLEQDEEEKAIECLNKTLALDENYIRSISELGLIYFHKDLEKSKDYYKKAISLSKKEFGGSWLKELEWDILENRLYLQSIQGLALIFWREYEIERAKELFALLLNLNPSDNQGIRYCMAAIHKGLTWEDFVKIDDKCAETGNYENFEKLLEEQNNFYQFWKNPGEKI